MNKLFEYYVILILKFRLEGKRPAQTMQQRFFPRQ